MSGKDRPSASHQLMIARDPRVAGAARVIGSLTHDTVQILVDAVDAGVATLDLAEVVHADDAGVRLLSTLRADRCTLAACPRWLELWLARADREADG